jgi:hypothetical protein
MVPKTATGPKGLHFELAELVTRIEPVSENGLDRCRTVPLGLEVDRAHHLRSTPRGATVVVWRAIVAAESDLRKEFSGTISLKHIHPLVGDLAKDRHGSQVVGMTPGQSQEFLLKVPRRLDIASGFLGANQLPQQRCFLERGEPIVHPYDLPCSLKGRDGQAMIPFFLIKKSQRRQWTDQVWRMDAILRLFLLYPLDDLPMSVCGRFERQL